MEQLEPTAIESIRAKQESMLEDESGFRRRFGPEFFRRIPPEPGVYFLKDRTREILYVGKSKNLRQRISSYRYLHKKQGPKKWRRLLEEVHTVEWSVCADLKKAELLENKLLRELKPPFNTASTRPEIYYFWGVDWQDEKLSLALRTDLSALEDYQVYGAFRGRQLCQRAQTSLLRLFHLSLLPDTPLPQPLNRPLALAIESLEFDVFIPAGIRMFWNHLLQQYLAGKNPVLVDTLVEHLVRTNPLYKEAFYQRWLEEDQEVLRQFFKIGPQRLAQARRQLGLKEGPIAQDQVDDIYIHLSHQS